MSRTLETKTVFGFQPSLVYAQAMSANLIIRQPLNSEFDCIADLWFGSWLSTGLGHTSGATRGDLRKRLEDEACWELLVAVRGGQIQGMVAFRHDISKLEQLFVHPECQRQGIGRHLMKAAKESLPSGMWLKVHRLNHNARRFYRSEGFVVDLERSGGVDAPEDVFYKWLPSV